MWKAETLSSFGRRICSGLPLSRRMARLMLASLLYTFDWKLADGLKPEDLDMSDKFGLVLHKAFPLLAIPVKMQLFFVSIIIQVK